MGRWVRERILANKVVLKKNVSSAILVFVVWYVALGDLRMGRGSKKKKLRTPAVTFFQRTVVLI